MVLDTSVTNQTYVESGEACCHPMELCYSAGDGEINDFEARILE